MNLLEETLNVLKERGKSPDDVRWCGWIRGFGQGWFTWSEFVEAAAKTNYDPRAEEFVTHSLVVVGDNWWLERFNDYTEACQWWGYKSMPIRPEKRRPVRPLAYKTSNRRMSDGCVIGSMHPDPYKSWPDFEDEDIRPSW